MPTRLGHKEGPAITFFDKAGEVKPNQLFIVSKDSVEGHGKATLKQLPTRWSGHHKSDDIATIIFCLRNDGHSYPDEIIAGIAHLLNDNYLHIQKIEEIIK